MVGDTVSDVVYNQKNHAEGSYDNLVIKIDESGRIDFYKVIGGTLDEESRGAIEIIENVFIIAGSSDSDDGDLPENNGQYDFWIFKIE
ncbi:MAG: hypothetical protein PWP54_1461 [Thermosipho sp. (in: thermotogales)]|nr:hypothetical protein [Thermosipho sp. (in: thermotogales)]